MNPELSHQQHLNVVITGASKGIGKALAEKFASEGHHVFLCARNKKHLEETAAAIARAYPGTVVNSVDADLSDKEEARQCGKVILEKIKRVDILINNAGQFIPGSVTNEADGTLEKMIGVNLYAAYHLTRSLLPAMMAARSGHIFNISSIAALKAYDNGGAYSISKFAVMGFSKNLREEMKAFNIKVTTVYPGAVYTSSWEGSGVERSRIMEANDIAEAIFSATRLSPQACIEDIVIRPQLGDL